MALLTGAWYDNLTRRGQDAIPALTTARWPLTGTGHQLTDEAGTALTLTQISTVTLTIYTLEVIPPVAVTGTWPRDIKNANGGSVSSTGLLVLVMPRADNALITATSAYERRRWVIVYTYATGAKTRELVVDRLIVAPL